MSILALSLAFVLDSVAILSAEQQQKAQADEMKRLMIQTNAHKPARRSIYYHHMYAQLLKPFRHEPDLTLLEIGANTGESLHLWAAYFPNIKSIYGVRWGITDKQMKPCTAGDVCGKIHLIDADQSKHSHLQSVVVKSLGSLKFSLDMASLSWVGTGYGVVIDDGSHIPRHMLLTFQTLWPYVRPGGVYILEDIGFSYSDRPGKIYGYTIGDGGVGKPSPGNLVEKFKQLADVVARPWCMPRANFTVFTREVDSTIWSVQFVSGVIIVQKQTADQQMMLQSVERDLIHLYGGHHLYAGPSAAEYREALEHEDRSWDAS